MPCSPLHDPAFPDRPSHPDFARLSEIILGLDGRLEAITDAGGDPGEAFQKMFDGKINLEAAWYMAQQRAMRAVMIVGAESGEGAGMRGYAAAASGYLEALLVGIMFAEKGGSFDSGPASL